MAYNVAVPDANRYKTEKVTTSVRHFFGVSPNQDDDLVAQNRTYYEGRLPKGVVAIAEAAGGNLICLDVTKGAVFFWDHEGEALQDQAPGFDNMQRLASSLSGFLQNLQPFDPKSVVLDPKNVVSIKVKPGFLEKFKKNV